MDAKEATDAVKLLRWKSDEEHNQLGEAMLVGADAIEECLRLRTALSRIADHHRFGWTIQTEIAQDALAGFEWPLPGDQP